jgi:hypothetical protein
LWSALTLPLAGLMFDFLDGKVARWRKSASMLGQELDSLADLVRLYCAPLVPWSYLSFEPLDILWSRSGTPCLRGRTSHLFGHCSADRIHLLWARSTGSIQRHGRTCSQKPIRKGEVFRGSTHPFLLGTSWHPVVLDV